MTQTEGRFLNFGLKYDPLLLKDNTAYLLPWMFTVSLFLRWKQMYLKV